MEAKNLRVMPPRRWSEQLAGIYWLPRLIDKARAAAAGSLGDYFFGQSPMDHSLLRVLGLGHRAFLALVEGAADDRGVVAELAARDPGAIERARVWSASLERKHRLFLWFLDVDDGYRGLRWFHRPVRATANSISRTVKRLWPGVNEGTR
jgi:hypothetical protein